jgi:hypothetical protein
MILDKIRELLHLVSIWSVVAPAFVGFLLFRKLSAHATIIWGMTVFAVVPQLLRYFVNENQVRTTVYNFYTVIEFLFASFFFISIFPIKKIAINLFILIGCFFALLFSVLCFLQGVSMKLFNETILLTNVYEIGFVLLFFYQTYSREGSVFIKGRTEKYFILGMLAYAPTTMVIFSLWYVLHGENSDIFKNLLMIHYVFNSVMYFFYTYGILLDSRKSALRLI